MSRRRKFREGPVCRSMDELIEHAKAGGWFYIWRSVYRPWEVNRLKPMTDPTGWYRRPLHPGWVLSFRTSFLISLMDAGLVALAIPNTEEGTND